jgi:Ca2+-binding EF-hand superfamily protein
MDLMCDINRVRMKSVSDNDVRAVFLLLDPGNTGFIDASGFIHWIKTGLIVTRANTSSTVRGPSAESMDRNISNLNTTNLTPDVVPLLKNSVSRKKYSSSVMNAEKR